MPARHPDDRIEALEWCCACVAWSLGIIDLPRLNRTATCSSLVPVPPPSTGTIQLCSALVCFLRASRSGRHHLHLDGITGVYGYAVGGPTMSSPELSDSLPVWPGDRGASRQGGTLKGRYMSLRCAGNLKLVSQRSIPHVNCYDVVGLQQHGLQGP